jgi:putative transposase
VTDQAIVALTPLVGVRAACAAVGESQARHYRRHRVSPTPPRPETTPKPQPRALSDHEAKEVKNLLDSEDNVDKSPAAIYYEQLDQGVYLASLSTFYRILRAAGEVHERRRQATHPAKVKPELVAQAPNEVWSWDITKLLGPAKWTYYYLYVIIDIYSRYVTGWMLARAENAFLAGVMFSETMAKHGIVPGTLSVHMDRGSPMTAKPFAHLLADLGVTKSYSRPHVSDDNPYSESQFKTMKYRHDFPNRFDSYENALAWCRRFFPWYCNEHRHSGIAYHTPANVYYGRSQPVDVCRQLVLDTAYAAHPERFVRKAPTPPLLPGAVWINKPEEVLLQATGSPALPEEVVATAH